MLKRPITAAAEAIDSADARVGVLLPACQSQAAAPRAGKMRTRVSALLSSSGLRALAPENLAGGFSRGSQSIGRGRPSPAPEGGAFEHEGPDLKSALPGLKNGIPKLRNGIP